MSPITSVNSGMADGVCKLPSSVLSTPSAFVPVNQVLCAHVYALVLFGPAANLHWQRGNSFWEPTCRSLNIFRFIKKKITHLSHQSWNSLTGKTLDILSQVVLPSNTMFRQHLGIPDLWPRAFRRVGWIVLTQGVPPCGRDLGPYKDGHSENH